MSKHIELVAKLREVFQIDRPDLDFGIYRILNTRAAEINAYLEQRLPEKVKAALAQGSAAQHEQVARELQEKEAQYQADGIDPGTVPKVRELREKLAQYQAGASEHENAVFSHLLAFFSRYYKDGDFISQRRYKGDTYAIPYAGEEVMLHWANKDQYYTKSGENFANYSFKLDDGRTVHFRLAAADTAKDNRKDNDKERRFALIARKTITRIDDLGDEVEEELLPVEEADGPDGKQLLVRFEYAPQPKGTRQDALVQRAVAAVLADEVVKARWLALGSRAPTEKDPQRTLLEKHLSDYTTKNTADFFIHKDLGSFLRRELDFYIKNEVMQLGDVQNAKAISDIEKSLQMIQCLRGIGLDLISFLAQLENFQKKIWLKKKFVVSSHYCITLDRVPESLFAEIASNDKQWVQWKNLGVWKGDTPKSIDELKSSPYRMVDTSLFPASFKGKILAEISDIEQFVDGLLVHGDNFHGIRLLGSRYGEAIDCIYIDPPYNTGPTEIIYKNYYKNSSWLSLMQDRLRPSRSLLRREACYAIAIDDFEMPRLCEAVDEVFAGYDRQMVVVNHHPQGGMSNNISRTHEYMLMLVPEGKDILRGRKKSGEIEYRSFQLSGPGRNKSRIGRPNSFYAVLIDGSKNRIVGLEPPPELGAAYPTGRTPEGYERRYPMSPEGEEKVWCRSYESALEGLDRGEIVLSENGALKLAVDTTDKRFSLMSNWTDSRYNAGPHGTALVANMIGDREAFSYPKSIHTVRDAVESMTWHTSNPVVLDFFAGSGTTGHAVINLNREDGGKRKYILMEMGQYFEAVTKPRIIKCVASTDWSAGVMQGNPSVHSHCIKVIKIEGYEDALNNLEMRRPNEQEDLFTKLPEQAKEDYLLNYMLDVESRGSVLSVQHFNKPFDYSLNIAVDSAGAFEPCKIDLVETFNYLIGLRVKQIDAQIERGFVTVSGDLPSGETCLVLWRDCEKLDYEGITKLCDKLAINPADNEYDVVYINGDHNIPTVLTQTAEEGGATRVLKLRQIEPEFLERMFSTEDV